MGMRQSIALHYSTGGVVNLYSHWGGEKKYRGRLARDLANALRRKERWDDESYLARIIFSEMVKGDISGETGYGISPYIIDEEYPTIHVHFTEKTVDGMSYEKYIALLDGEDIPF